MRVEMKFRSQSGFTLVQAIFILTVLTFLGVAMMRLSSVQVASGTLSLQQARAYQLARSGLEWGAARAEDGNPCNGSFNLEGFLVTVSCSSSDFTEAAATTTVYTVESTATYASYGSPDYVSRRVEMKVALP